MHLGKKKILITGANGFLGYEIYKFLSNKKKTLGTSRKRRKNFIKLDYPNDKIDENILVDVNTVIHLASLDKEQVIKDIKLSNKINVNFTDDLIKKCIKKKVKNFIYFSSTGIYGRNLKNKVNENIKPLPKDIYSKLKYITEKKIIKKKDIRVVILRISNIVGTPTKISNGFSKLFLPEICISALKRNKIILNYDGKQYRDLLDLRILLKIIQSLIENLDKLKNNEIFNVSSGKSVQICEVTNKVKKIIKKKYNLDIKIIKGFESKEHNYQIDNKKLKRFLNINISNNLENIISKLINFLHIHEKRSS